MKCPYCTSNDLKVLETRETRDMTRRRRECLKCDKRFTTYERIEFDLVVLKKDGKKEPFDRDKIRVGLLKACNKRPVTKEKIEKTVDKIEQELRKLNSHEIKSKIIGNKVTTKLKSLDKVAYMRFVSVYKDFDNIKAFKEEIKKL